MKVFNLITNSIQESIQQAIPYCSMNRISRDHLKDLFYQSQHPLAKTVNHHEGFSTGHCDFSFDHNASGLFVSIKEAVRGKGVTNILFEAWPQGDFTCEKIQIAKSEGEMQYCYPGPFEARLISTEELSLLDEDFGLLPVAQTVFQFATAYGFGQAVQKTMSGHYKQAF